MTSSDKKKQEIVNAAAAYFGKYGFSKTTLDDIAGYLGMKKNSLYYYFPSKEALYKEVIKENIIGVFEKITDAVATKKTAAEKILMVFETAEKIKGENANIQDLSVQAAIDMQTSFTEIYEEYHQRAVSLFHKIISDGIKSGEFKKCNAAELAAAIVEMTDSIRIKKFYNSKVKYVNEIDFSASQKHIYLLMELIIEGLKK